MRRIFLPLAICASLAACDKNSQPLVTTSPPPSTSPSAGTDSSSCSSPTVPKIIQESVSENVEGEARDLNKQMPETQRLDLSKVRALASEMEFQLRDIITTKNDPNSSKKFCEALLTLNVPTNTLDSANKARKERGLKLFQTVAEDANFKVDINKFSIKISYSAQLTDDRTKMQINWGDGDAAETLATQIILFAALKNKSAAVDSSAQKEALSAPPATRENLPLDESAPQKAPSKLTEKPPQAPEPNDDSNDYAQAEREINNLWRALPKNIQDENRVAQRAFNANKESTCLKEASTAGSGQQFEVAKERCWLRFYRQRIPELRALVN